MMKFPKRLHGKMRLISIRPPGNKPMGGFAKIYLRNIAKGFPEYHQKIETGISGEDNFGNEIPINTVGRWLFGTPGYMGHIRVSNWDGDIKVEVPADSPEIVFKLLKKLKDKIES